MATDDGVRVFARLHFLKLCVCGYDVQRYRVKGNIRDATVICLDYYMYYGDWMDGWMDG